MHLNQGMNPRCVYTCSTRTWDMYCMKPFGINSVSFICLSLNCFAHLYLLYLKWAFIFVLADLMLLVIFLRCDLCFKCHLCTSLRLCAQQWRRSPRSAFPCVLLCYGCQPRTNVLLLRSLHCRKHSPVAFCDNKRCSNKWSGSRNRILCQCSWPLRRVCLKWKLPVCVKDSHSHSAACLH